MRILWIILVLCSILFFYSPAISSDIELKAGIDQVVLYPDVALIKKSGRVALKQGENRLKLSGLTPELIDNSIQLEVSGSARIRDVRVMETYLSKITQERLEELKARLEKLKTEAKRIESEISVLNSLNDFLQNIIPFSQQQNTSVQEISTYLAFMEKRLLDNLIKISELETKLARVNEEKKAIENEINQIADKKEKSKVLLMDIYAPQEGDYVITISYLVRGAGWSPAYDLRVDSSEGDLFIDYIASIRQTTGEDWKDVPLILTTQKPAPGGVIPELKPWYLDVYGLKSVILEHGLPLLGTGAIISPSGAKDRYKLPEPVIELTSVSFSIPYRIDVPSDGEPHRVAIASSKADAEIKYYSVPKKTASVFAIAQAKNPFAFTMLPGPANVFLDGRFVSSSNFSKPVVTDEKISFPLGIDEGIKIERKLEKKFTEYSGAFTKNTIINYEYSITITNGKRRDIDVEVKDQFPVSKNEKIKVKLKEPLPTDAEITQDGFILWKFVLRNAETKKLFIKFTVEYPKDLVISGLE